MGEWGGTPSKTIAGVNEGSGGVGEESLRPPLANSRTPLACRRIVRETDSNQHTGAAGWEGGGRASLPHLLDGTYLFPHPAEHSLAGL